MVSEAEYKIIFLRLLSSYSTWSLLSMVSPKALLLHFKRFIVTQEVRAPAKTSEGKDDAPPVMEMVLKKNKVR